MLVIGSSIGGWIGADMAARDNAGLISGLVLIDSVGVLIAGQPIRYMHDPGLAARLGRVEIPVLVLWGDSDRIVTPGYGQAMAAAFPQAQFAVISQAGHLPQLEQPDATFGVLDAFIRKNPGRPAA